MRITEKFLILLGLFAATTFAATDWVAPQKGSLYDWRNTTWFGGCAGTVTGPGISIEHWGENQGFRITALPIVEYRHQESNNVLFLGGAYLQSVNNPKATPASNYGFTTTNIFWYIGGFGGGGHESNGDWTRGGSVSGGFGIELNRRDARWSFLLGLGPYYMQTGNEFEMRIYPTFEVGWHFGAPRRISP